jgi:predicted neuraminidase
MKNVLSYFSRIEIYKLFLIIIFLFPFNGKGQEVSEAILVEEFIYESAPFPSCHASTIIETPECIAAAWFGGTHEQHEDVEIWLSRKLNGKWITPVSIADGIQEDGKRYPCWNPVLFQIPGGKLILFYKVGPNPREWWGIIKTSGDNGKTWSEAQKLPEGFLGPIKNKPVLLENGSIISPSSSEHNGWRIHFEISADMAESWKMIGPLNNSGKFNIIQPSILNYGSGRLQALCRSIENRVVSLWSEDYGKNWSEPETTGLPNPNSGTDAVTLKNGLQLIVYNHSERKKDEWGGERTPLNIAVSSDGKDWKQVLTLEDEPGEYSYPAVIQTEDGLIHIIYTWKREKIKHVVIDPEKVLLNQPEKF